MAEPEPTLPEGTYPRVMEATETPKQRFIWPVSRPCKASPGARRDRDAEYHNGQRRLKRKDFDEQQAEVAAGQESRHETCAEGYGIRMMIDIQGARFAPGIGRRVGDALYGQRNPWAPPGFR